MYEAMNEVLQFQFLRPWWFLGLLPVAWFVWRAWQVTNQLGAWHQVIAPQFRRLLLGENQSGEVSVLNKLSVLGLGFIWFLAILALSGPSLKSVQMPAEKNQQGTVILLDLSLSMLADDLAPNRLSRVKYKITDLVKQHPELSIGLVGYAGSAHSISPISEDNQTLLGLLPALNPVIMPRYGSNPLLGFEQAKQLLEGAFINHGHIIWITDDLEATQQSAIRDWIKSHDYSVSIMPVGTATGGAVQIPNYGLLKDDDGKIILPQLPIARFVQLGTLSGVTVTPLSIGDDSVTDLLPPTSISREQKDTDDKAENKTTDNNILHALDEGASLLILLLPLVALLYRRGWVLSLSLAMILPLGLLGSLTPTPSYAETELPNFTDVFQSPNQQAYKAWQSENYQAAEALFEDNQWRASTLYRLGKYTEAAPLFGQDKSAKGHYNHGNALAKSGQLEQAKLAYENALKQQPDFAAAEQNLGLVTQLLQQQEQDKPQEQQPDSQSQKSGSEQDNPSSENQEKQGGKQDNSESDQNNSQANKAENPSEKSPSDLSDTSDIADSKQANDALNKPTPPDGAAPTNPENAEAESQSPAADSADSVKQTSGTADTTTDIAEDKALPGLADSKLSEQTTNGLPQGDATQAAQGENTPTEEQQATRNWLKQIPDEPGVFLKRKFEYQYQQQSAQPKGNSSSDQSSNKQW